MNAADDRPMRKTRHSHAGRLLVSALGLWALFASLGSAAEPSAAGPAQSAARNAWYWNSPVNIHWDNHGNPLGKGMTAQEIAALFAGLKVDMIQVSARSGYTTFPSSVGVPNPKLEGYDTIATWNDVTRRLGARLWIYINVIDEPYLIDKHPQWRRVDAQGNRARVCNRPSADGSGYLEQVMIPLVREIIDRYHPQGFWFDGDWQIPPVCYCGNCRAAWKQLTGQDEPPRDTKDATWPKWADLEQERLEQYKQQLADAIHDADPRCCYVSNWSWAISQRDPRTAPALADVLSGDVGAGTSQNALNACRFAALMLSAQEHTPHDVMSAIYPKKIRTLPRMLQEGSLVMSSGSSWFLWLNQLTVEQFAHARRCYQLVDARRADLGRTHSFNPVAVLLSETSWRQAIGAREPGYFDSNSPRNWAFALQDAWYGVDVVNEQTLQEQLDHWKIVVVANQRQVQPATLDQLQRFVQRGGTLIVTDGALRAADGDAPQAAGLLGLTRKPWPTGGKQRLAIGGQPVPVRMGWAVECRGAEVLERLAGSDAPVLTSHRIGQGRAVYLALTGGAYPDEDGLTVWLMRKLGLGPLLSVAEEARDRHLVFSLRRRSAQQLILHAADLTSLVDGKRVEPNSSHAIDDVPPIPRLGLQVPLPVRPTAVKVVPDATSVTWQHVDSVLQLELRNFQTHAAVLLDAPPTTSASLLPAAAHTAMPRSYGDESLILAEAFESTPLGRFPPLPVWSASVDPKTAIRVAVDPTAAGNHVLEFADAPDARAAFLPYLTIQPPRLDRGRARFGCDFYLEPQAAVSVELRDNTAGATLTGPSIKITDAGKLQAAGKVLTTVPVGQWFRLELEFGLGFEPPVYSLAVIRPDKPAERFANLPYASRGFSSCSWLGITSNAVTTTRFYADNIRLERLP